MQAENTPKGRRAGGLIRDYIGGGEFYSLALVLCTGGYIWLGTAEKNIGSMAWLLVAAAFACSLLELLTFVCWLRLFGGQSFADSLVYALGRAGGRIVLFAYVLFWLVLAWAALGYITDFWVELRPTEMPLWLYAALFLLTAAAFAVTGEAALGRVAMLVVLPALLLVLGNLLLTVFGSDPGNLLPLVYNAHLPLLSVEAAVLVFGNLCVLLPYLEHAARPACSVRHLLSASVTAALLWACLAMGSLAVLGASLALYDFPILQVFRLAEVGHWLSRFEVIGAVLLEALALIRLSALLTAALGGLRSLWGQHTLQRACLIAVGLVACLLAAFIAGQNNAMAVRLVSGGFGGLFWLMLIFAVVLPWLVIVGGYMHKRAENRTIVVRSCDHNAKNGR